jgi:dTDP-4-amino-4,6-dideoxygalactose transaminase
MRIEFGELVLGDTAKKHMQDVLSSSWASSGPKTKLFEEGWGKLFNYKYNKAVSSGTDAGINAVMALYEFGAIRGKSEVIVPALSFIATSNAVLAAGLVPRFVDVEKHTLNIDPSKIEAAINENTVGIKVVHTMGKMCEMDKIRDIADKHNLKIIEDSCEAHGAQYKGEYPGGYGDCSTFSYYIAHLICCGEGGMVSTDDKVIADAVDSTRSHGRLPGSLYFDHVRNGFNSKMNDMEASLGLEGIDEFWDTFDIRKKNLYYMMDKFAKYSDKIWMNTEEEHESVCPHGYSFTFKDPEFDVNAFSDYLTKNEIKNKRNFGAIPTQHRAFEFMGHKLGDFPNAEYIGDHGIHIGCHRYLSGSDLDYVVETVSNYLDKNV